MSRLRASDPGDQGRIALEKAFGILEGRAVDGRSRAGSGTGITKAGASRVTHVRVPPIEPKPPAAKAPPPLAGATAGRTSSRRRHRKSSSPRGRGRGARARGARARPTRGGRARGRRIGRARGGRGTGRGRRDGPAGRDGGTRDAARRGAEPVPETVPSRSSSRCGPPSTATCPPDLDVAALAATATRRSSAVRGRRARPGCSTSRRRYRRDCAIEAALDTCYLALSVAPDDVGLHLALVELYDGRGWATLAARSWTSSTASSDVRRRGRAPVAAPGPARGCAGLRRRRPATRGSAEGPGPGATLARGCSRSSSRSSDRSR